MTDFQVEANLIDIHTESIYPARITVGDGIIQKIEKIASAHSQDYILPGFVDSHIHIESSMLVPSEFARLATAHGTVATVSDPHEIANVLGEQGVRFMVENGRRVNFKFFFGMPSCVPATAFETSGASLGADSVRPLVGELGLKYLSEMMNFPGVLFDFPDVMAKLEAARSLGIPIDGHAPGLGGDSLRKYASSGISTDHECTNIAEASEKITAGMKILIREGSAAKNYEALKPLLASHPRSVMLCSDDRHPDSLEHGHINELVRRAISDGFGLFDVLRAAISNPIAHYGLEVGMLREGDPADFIIIDNPKDFQIKQTFINGRKVAEHGKTTIKSIETEPINNFKAERKSIADFACPPRGKFIRVINAIEGELLTTETIEEAFVIEGNTVSDTGRDILKMCVVNRYENVAPAIGFIKNFGLKHGAIASSVGHDSHNIIAVAADDVSLAAAVNAVIDARGGMAVSDGSVVDCLALPVAGLMSAAPAEEVAAKYSQIEQKARALGSPMMAPFMTLSFMALLVIPEIKLSDKGLFDGRTFSLIDLFAPEQK